MSLQHWNFGHGNGTRDYSPKARRQRSVENKVWALI
jgi:hypothetical protein